MKPLYKRVLEKYELDPFNKEWLEKQDWDTLSDVYGILANRIEELAQTHLFIIDWGGKLNEKWQGNGSQYAIIESTMCDLWERIDYMASPEDCKAMIVNSAGKHLGTWEKDEPELKKEEEGEYDGYTFYLELGPLGTGFFQHLNRHGEHVDINKENKDDYEFIDQWFDPWETWEEMRDLEKLCGKIEKLQEALEAVNAY